MKNIKQWDADECFGFSLGMVALAIVSIGLVSAVKSICASGRPDYCYVDGSGGTPALLVKEHVPWRPDRIVAVAHDNIEAQQLLKTSCSVPDGRPH